MEHGDEKRKRLERDERIAVRHILEEADPNPYVILLCGGYGRDEGAWYKDKDGVIQPYNDYDLAVVSDKPFPAQSYEALRREIADEAGIKWIDIDWYSPKQMQSLHPTIKNYDLLNASKVIYGDENFLDNCKQIRAADIGEYDVVTLYKTRIWTFLGAWTGEFHDLDTAEAMFFRNQMAKAVLAACDMILVKEKQYTWKYSDRVERIQGLHVNKKKLCKMAAWAYKEKTSPNQQSLSKEEMEKLYNDAYTLFSSSMKYAMSKKAQYFDDPHSTKKYFVRHTRYPLSVVFNKIVRHSNLPEKYLDVFLIQNYVYRAYSKAGRNKEYLAEAFNLLRKWGYEARSADDWNELRQASAYARNNI